MDVPLEALEFSLVRRELQKRGITGEPYLEVGCGDGFNLERLSVLGMHGVGIDISKEAIEILRDKKIAGVEVIEGDFLRMLPLLVQPKLIFMLNILEHVHEDAWFIEKAFSILPRGGVLIIAAPANSKAFGFADFNAGHLRRYDKNDLQEKLKHAGFVIDTWMSVGFPVNRTYTRLFNILNGKKLKLIKEHQTVFSGIRNKARYYGGAFDFIAKIAFPLLSIAIQFDRLFVRTNLGNNFVVFAKKTH